MATQGIRGTSWKRQGLRIDFSEVWNLDWSRGREKTFASHGSESKSKESKELPTKKWKMKTCQNRTLPRKPEDPLFFIQKSAHEHLFSVICA